MSWQRCLRRRSVRIVGGKSGQGGDLEAKTGGAFSNGEEKTLYDIQDGF